MDSEARIQYDCVMWFKNEYAKETNYARLFFHVNNRSMNVKEGSNLVGMGLTKGVSDCLFLCPVYFKKDFYPFVCVEFKDHKGKQSEAQILFQKDAENVGGLYVVIRSLEQFKEFINSLELCKSIE